MMEIKLDKALVPKRLQEELTRRCVKTCYSSGADSSVLQDTNEAVQGAYPLKYSASSS